MGLFRRVFGGGDEPSKRQISRAIKQVTQPHGESATRVAAMERLAGWKCPEAAAALLRRFTIQVPQASMDLEEKQYTVRLLVQIGRPAVEPVLHFLQAEAEVTWPIQALKEILSPEDFQNALKNVLERLASSYTRWPEAKTVLIQHLPDEAYPLVRETVVRFLADEDDDVCIAAAGYLARSGDEEGRELLIQTFLNAESRPRVRGHILDLFCEREWPVKGYRKKVEEALVDPFYLTSKGTVKRRAI